MRAEGWFVALLRRWRIGWIAPVVAAAALDQGLDVWWADEADPALSAAAVQDSVPARAVSVTGGGTGAVTAARPDTTAKNPVAAPPAAVAPPAIPAVARWRVTEETDPLDDSRLVRVSVDASGGPPATLAITCRSRRLSVEVVWPRRLADAALIVRADGERARDDSNQWALSADSLALLYQGDPRRFLRELLTVSRWVAAATSRSGTEAAQFDLRELEERAGALREGCGWP